MNQQDVDVVEAARAGDCAALNDLLRRSRQDLRRYAEYHCVVNDIEDAVQESLIIVSRRLRDLRSAESFTSWLFRIVKRECNRMRRAWRLLTNQDIGEALQPTAPVEPVALRMDVSRVLAALPEHYREILIMRDVEGLSLRELSSALGLELAATKSRLHRARMVARDMLRGHSGAVAET